MNDLEASLKELIIERYGSLKRFCDIIGMPLTTLDSILKRGVANSNISNVLKITKELCIDTEKLVDGEIVHTSRIDKLNDLESKPTPSPPTSTGTSIPRTNWKISVLMRNL